VRCFVAVRPDGPTRRRLGQLASQALLRFAGARRIREDNLHLTLAFIGELDAARAREAAQGLAALPLQPFTWRIERIGRFARSAIVWAGGDGERPAQWSALVRDRLAQLRIGFDAKPFVAHVTLLRDVPALVRGTPETESIEPIDWPLDRAELLVSTRDPSGAVRYATLAAG
jgi:RNA 2',3'-cyclic 3'-phosphodiesterase